MNDIYTINCKICESMIDINMSSIHKKCSHTTEDIVNGTTCIVCVDKTHICYAACSSRNEMEYVESMIQIRSGIGNVFMIDNCKLNKKSCV